MKVLHVYRTYFPDPPGGLQEAIRQIALATRPQGVDARIFTLSPEPHPEQIQFDEGTVIRAKSWAAPASCDLGGLSSVLAFRKWSAWADVLHFHFPWLGTAYEPLMRWMLGSMDAVVATSPAYAATSMALRACVSPERLRTIPLGIADYRDSPLSVKGEDVLERLALNGKPYFLALGVLRYYKGLHTLIEAAPAIGTPIVIAGSGPERERLAALAKQVGAHNVVFAGQVTHDEKVALLRGCRAMVLPSHLRSEAFGMVLVEAEMFGKPMICCEVGSGTSYVNEHGVTGLVVEPEHPEALAQAMATFLADDALVARMGQAARTRYEAMFSGPALGDAYYRLYRDVS